MRLFYNPILLLLALLASASVVSAQEQEQNKRVFTLQEAIAHAVENNVSVKNELLNEGIATAQVKETVAQGLPQINGSLNYTNNLEVQIQYLPDFISPSVYGVLETEGLVEANPNRFSGGYFPAQFGTPHAASAAITVNQLLFNGSYFVGLRASKVFKELSNKNVKKANIDVAEAVALAYYGALVANERLELLEANLQRLDTLYEETVIMNENGFVEAIDVQRLKVNLNNLRTEYENVERSLVLNLAALKFQMGLPVQQEIELKESISDFEIESMLPNDDIDHSQRIEYQQLIVTRELAELDIKNTRVQYYPTLSAFGNIGYNAGKANFESLFKETPDIEVEGEIVPTHTWNRFASVGINLNVPIFDGFLKANTIRRKKLLAEQVDNQMRNLENAIDLEVEQSRINLQNNLQSLETQQENMALAEEVFRVTKIKYQQGVGSNLEVVEAENALKTAETNYYQALYNALVARVTYDKATGTLYQ